MDHIHQASTPTQAYINTKIRTQQVYQNLLNNYIPDHPKIRNQVLAIKINANFKHVAQSLREDKRNSQNIHQTPQLHQIDKHPLLQPLNQPVIQQFTSTVQNYHNQQKFQLTYNDYVKLGSIKAEKISKIVKPQWHKPWKLMKVIVGHMGWVRCIAIDPANEFFVTGSNDRTIKFWNLATGKLKISLTGHINAIRALIVSHKHPYLFSCAQDKSIKCWDLQMNKVIRSYHGHLSGVYCMHQHPTIQMLFSGGRDAVVRCWDIRMRVQAHILQGHNHTVGSVVSQQFEPQVISGSYDSTVKIWDLAAGKCMNTLTNHKKSIRDLVIHPKEYTFASGASDNIKVWKCPQGQFLRNISGHNAIVNCLAINDDNVMVSGGDDGSIKFWDWKSGYNFQTIHSKPQPGSISAQAGIFCSKFDRSSLRLITGQCDKTIKIWCQDNQATQQTFPIDDFRFQFMQR